MVKSQTQKCHTQIPVEGVAIQGQEGPEKSVANVFPQKSHLYITCEHQQRQKGHQLPDQCTKLREGTEAQKQNVPLPWWWKRCTERNELARGLFYLTTTPLRLQNSVLKTTATFLEDKDIQQNKVEKRKNSLMLFQNKSLERVI